MLLNKPALSPPRGVGVDVLPENSFANPGCLPHPERGRTRSGILPAPRPRPGRIRGSLGSRLAERPRRAEVHVEFELGHDRPRTALYPIVPVLGPSVSRQDARGL